MKSEVEHDMAGESHSKFVGLCSKCGYSLVGLAEHRCPECGQGFDPADPKSFRPVGTVAPGGSVRHSFRAQGEGELQLECKIGSVPHSQVIDSYVHQDGGGDYLVTAQPDGSFTAKNQRH